VHIRISRPIKTRGTCVISIVYKTTAAGSVSRRVHDSAVCTHCGDNDVHELLSAISSSIDMTSSRQQSEYTCYTRD